MENEPSVAAAEMPNLEILMDVPVKLSAALASTHKSTEEVLRFEVGSIIELDQLADGPVDLCINRKSLALGEIVLMGDNLGVRVTEMKTRKQ